LGRRRMTGTNHTFRLDDPDAARLRRLADLLGCSRTDVLRLGMALVARHEPEARRLLDVAKQRPKFE
jgi:hypothetical protein